MSTLTHVDSWPTTAQAARYRQPHEINLDRHRERMNIRQTPDSQSPAVAGPLSALIVARSAQFRESLAVLVSAIPQIAHIEQADDLSVVFSADAGPPDLMLCDYESVQEETVETLRVVKARWPHMRCVVLVEDRAAYRQAQRVGADMVLTKGVLAARLLETIEGLLSGRSAGQSS